MDRGGSDRARSWRDASQRLASNATSNQLGFYDVAPGGKKILLNLVSQQVSQSVTVITNFTVGLKK